MELTDDEIKKIRAQYGPFKVVYVEMDGNDKAYRAVFKKNVGRNAVSKAMSLASSDPVMSNEVIYRDVIINDYSDKEILENSSMFLAMGTHLQALLEQKKTNSMDY